VIYLYLSFVLLSIYREMDRSLMNKYTDQWMEKRAKASKHFVEWQTVITAIYHSMGKKTDMRAFIDRYGVGEFRRLFNNIVRLENGESPDDMRAIERYNWHMFTSFDEEANELSCMMDIMAYHHDHDGIGVLEYIRKKYHPSRHARLVHWYTTHV
jgi:hypothetical protein